MEITVTKTLGQCCDERRLGQDNGPDGKLKNFLEDEIVESLKSDGIIISVQEPTFIKMATDDVIMPETFIKSVAGSVESQARKAVKNNTGENPENVSKRPLSPFTGLSSYASSKSDLVKGLLPKRRQRRYISWKNDRKTTDECRRIATSECTLRSK